MPKIEEIKKETCLQVRKKRYKMATTNREKIVSNLTEKSKSGIPLLKFLKTIGIEKKKKSKGNSRNKLGNLTKKVKTFLNKLRRGNLKVVTN